MREPIMSVSCRKSRRGKPSARQPGVDAGPGGPAQADETVRQGAALEEGVELVLDELRQASADGLLGMGEEGLCVPLFQAGVQRDLLGAGVFRSAEGRRLAPGGGCRPMPCTRFSRRDCDVVLSQTVQSRAIAQRGA